MEEQRVKLLTKINEMSDIELSDLLLMANNLRYFDSVPDVYKDLIHKVFGCAHPVEED